MSTAIPVSSFDEAWAQVEAIPGWLSRDQAEMLWDAVLRLRRGARVVEIGSHQGRSTIVLGHAARRVGARVTAVDPFVDGRLFGGQSTRVTFDKHIAAAGLADIVDLEAEFSTVLRCRWDRPVDLLYIDGKHDYWTFADDLRWSAWQPPGGEILVHDCYSSIGVTSGVLFKVLPSRRHTYLDRAGSLARFALRTPSWPDRARLLRQLPWFVRNVLIKVLLRLRLGRLAGALGHHGPYDPF
ncbi:MAG: class I SAM-dependent methyltransferase [Micromonosporaceae bacterium]|nr:class I SAM-dependent methyltransferase [Micromonosporaceae bacterium]